MWLVVVSQLTYLATIPGWKSEFSPKQIISALEVRTF
jgi:hypothetical protein